MSGFWVNALPSWFQDVALTAPDIYILIPCSKAENGVERGRIISLMQLALIREEIAFPNRISLVFHWPKLGHITVLSGKGGQESEYLAFSLV